MQKEMGEKKLIVALLSIYLSASARQQAARLMRETGEGRVIINISDNGPNNDRGQPAYKVGLFTSAAPTYFPSVNGFIDGGVHTSNPSMCALAQTQDQRYNPTPSLEDVVLLSLVTGISLQYVKGHSHDWGYIQWIKPLASLMLEGTAGIADYQCSQILNTRYHRLTPVFPPGISVQMDDVKKIPYMIEFAESVSIEGTIAWLNEHWSAT